MPRSRSDFCTRVRAGLPSYLRTADISEQVELIFVDDGSSRDGRRSCCARPAPSTPSPRRSDLSRNFGQHIALSLRLRPRPGRARRHAQRRHGGSARPDPAAARRARERRATTSSSDVRRSSAGRRCSTRSPRAASTAAQQGSPATTCRSNTATLRVMNRRFVDAYNPHRAAAATCPGLEMWLGFRRGYVPIRHARAHAGQSSYTSGAASAWRSRRSSRSPTCRCASPALGR